MQKRSKHKGSKLAAWLTQPGDHYDGGGLFLAVNAHRSGVWKYRYVRPDDPRLPRDSVGKSTKMTLGECFLSKDGDSVQGWSLEQARAAWEVEAGKVARGIDPNAELAAQKDAQQQAAAAAAAEAADRAERAKTGKAPKDSFRDVAEKFFDLMAKHWKSETFLKAKEHMKAWAYPAFGDTHINEVALGDIKAMVRKITEGGTKRHKTMIRVRTLCNKVFNWAIANDLRTQATPVFELDDLTKKEVSVNNPRPSVSGEENVRKLMCDINGALLASTGSTAYEKSKRSVLRALLFCAYTAQRADNINNARWDQIDGNVWVIPAEKMKGRLVDQKKDDSPHIVHLSKQAIRLLEQQRAEHPNSEYVFPGVRGGSSRINKVAMNHRLNSLGYEGKHCPHGFRAMMRTHAHGCVKINAVHLERVLAHKQAVKALDQHRHMDGGHGVSYNRIHLLVNEQEELELNRIGDEVMSMWGDWLEGLMRPQLALVA